MNIQPGFEAASARPGETPPTRARGSDATQPSSSGSTATANLDTAHISSAALSAAAAAAEVSDVRPEKIAAVQQALANGSYAVSPSDVAGKLIDHLLQR